MAIFLGDGGVATVTVGTAVATVTVAIVAMMEAL
jgi:hypothetical protein